MKKILGILTWFLSFSLISCNENITEQLVFKKVLDGDTVYLNNKKKGRIFGIDAPEIKNKFWNKTKGVKQSAALSSKSKLFYLLRNKRLKIIKITKDKYGRDVIKIESNNQDIGILMVRLGMARVAYISNKKKHKFFSTDEIYYKKLLDAQYFAFVNNVGIWSRKDLYKKIFSKAI